ncbi:hypothetical protein OUZ56_011283 [Daphnia magna]|uniref:Uncharacterized protein n=1 Tax=Daphnia magna TaxID=35525 RepID=A0ABQ9YZQ7_9CRUS|nr:hypothetical protein OUZ56_011283 [Daphnia magna]
MSKETVQMVIYVANGSKERVAVMEMTYCCLLADRNVAISFIDALVPVEKKLHAKDEVTQHMHLGFGMGIKLRIIDETTDVQVDSQLAVLIQYYDSETLTSAVHLLDMLVMDGATADCLSNAIIQQLNSLQIPLSRLIGFCSDTCNVMYGTPIRRCVAYTRTLAEVWLEDGHLMPFKSSSKLPHSILSPGQTRWLSLEQCVLRVLEQLPALILYFKEEYEDDQCLNEFNTLFQSEAPLLFSVRAEFEKHIKDFANNFMYKSYTRTRPARKIDPYLTNKYCTEDELYFVIVQLKQRFNLDDPLYDLLDFLSPKRARNLTPAGLSDIFDRFPVLKSICDSFQAELEWRSHANLTCEELGCTS